MDQETGLAAFIRRHHGHIFRSNRRIDGLSRFLWDSDVDRQSRSSGHRGACDAFPDADTAAEVDDLSAHACQASVKLSGRCRLRSWRILTDLGLNPRQQSLRRRDRLNPLQQRRQTTLPRLTRGAGGGVFAPSRRMAERAFRGVEVVVVCHRFYTRP